MARSFVASAVFAAALLSAAVLDPSTASAQAIDGPRGELYGQLSLSVNDYEAGGVDVGTGVLFAPYFGGYYEVASQFALSFEWGFGVYHFSPEVGDNDNGAFFVGNPTIGGHFFTGSGHTRGRVGVILALPAASTDDDDAVDVVTKAIGYGVALGANGLWDAWLWFPDAFTMAVPGRLESLVSDHLLLAGEGAIGLMVPVRDGDGDGRENELLTQLGGEIAYDAPTVRAGLRLRGAWFVTGIGGDDAQLAMEPFIQLAIGSSTYFRARFTINFDDPYGFSFDDRGVWGLHLGIGGAI